ncbi:MAG TPA: response regulator [Candidatus Nitrosocosmicus sp.]|nr:response regulator [Candidatus Nitrosocosmicus sp.]
MSRKWINKKVADDLANKNSTTNDKKNIHLSSNVGGLQDNQITFVNFSNNYCVCIIDIIDSTNNTFDILESKKIKQYYSVFLNTMTSIIGRHGGKVIKNAGDNLLYYFPNTMNESNYLDFQDVIECGLSMIDAKDQVDLLLNLNGLPPINYRISASYGKVELAIVGNSHTGDIFGTPVNICSKINHLASSNQMIIHRDLYQVMKEMPYFDDYVFEELDRKNDVNDYTENNRNTYTTYSVRRFEDINKQKEIESKILELHAERKRINQNKNNSSFNILLIDDDKDILFTYSAIIKSQGFTITSFSNPYEALNDFSTTNPYLYDLVIMDIRMPGINGIKLYSKFKVMNPNVKIIFASALDAVGELLSLFPEISNSDILRKPVESQQLLDKINTAIRN